MCFHGWSIDRGFNDNRGRYNRGHRGIVVNPLGEHVSLVMLGYDVSCKAVVVGEHRR